MRYSFEWDPRKAKENLQKHGVSFDRASTLFLDPNAISVFDDEHSHDEDRWSTIGLYHTGTLLVIVHTFYQIDPALCKIRVISARRATRQEVKQYREENP